MHGPSPHLETHGAASRAVFSTRCAALAATPRRLLRPRRRDERLLARLQNAGLPQARAIVRLTALPQARVTAPDRPVTGLADALKRVGRDVDDIDFVLPTHLHWDHVAGLLELPAEVAVRTLPVERDFALDAGGPPLGVASLPLRGRRFDTYHLDGPPVLTFDRSHDLFADGSVVLVDLAGHTPGSVGALLNLDGDRRVLLAGDAVWHRLQVRLLRQKAPLPGRLVDDDRDATFASVHRLHALPSTIEIIASHDRDAAARWSPARRD